MEALIPVKQLVEPATVKGGTRKKKNKKIKRMGRMTLESIRGLSALPAMRFRQFYIPSATTFTVSGTAATYSATTGALTIGTANTFWSLYFRIGDLTQVSTFQALYDQYKIENAIVHFTPAVNASVNVSATASSAVLNWLPHFFTVVDTVDSSVLSNVTDAFQYDTCMVARNSKGFTRNVLKPQLAVGSGTGFISTTGWVDFADTTVQHYGMKGAHGVSTANSAYILGYFVVELDISLRKVK